jgi:S-adenosylmethionine:tRNA ribosyltransferase-isomerase
MPISLNDFDFPLDPERIAQQPVEPRDASRLLCLQRNTGRVTHHIFRELDQLLRAGDLLVFNDTRVLPARFFAVRATGGRVEGLFLRQTGPGQWVAMLRGARRCRIGEVLTMENADDVSVELVKAMGQGRYELSVNPPAEAEQILLRAGTAPLPPYIRRPGSVGDADDQVRYQTIYSQRPGAVAAPTAGLHFTRELLDRLDTAGIEKAFLTLHVGPGTFLPVKVDDPARHEMHSEQFELSPETAETINRAKGAGRRVIAVGTTVVRVLETLGRAGRVEPGRGETDIFIYPPATFEVVDALITNFHLPKSTLLMLVSAFCAPQSQAGAGTILDAYAEAQREGYRFYSYGDAMLIE